MIRLPDGTVLQSGIPRDRWRQNCDVRGLLLRGVVLKVYLPDDPNHPAKRNVRLHMGVVGSDGAPGAEIGQLVAGAIAPVVCDVLVYGGGFRNVLPNVLVSQPGGHGKADGAPRVPRGSTHAANGGLAVPAKALGSDDTVRNITPPGDLDGDHVIVGFLEGDLNQPVILDYLTHPQGEIPFAAYQAPDASHGEVAERVIRHRGTVILFDRDGNLDIDARAASPGVYAADGTELPHPVAGSSGGQVRIRTSGGGTVTITPAGAVTVQAPAGQDVTINGENVRVRGAAHRVARKDDPVKVTISAVGTPAWEAFFTALAALIGGGPALYTAAKAEGIPGTITDGNPKVTTD